MTASSFWSRFRLDKIGFRRKCCGYSMSPNFFEIFLLPIFTTMIIMDLIAYISLFGFSIIPLVVYSILVLLMIWILLHTATAEIIILQICAVPMLWSLLIGKRCMNASVWYIRKLYVCKQAGSKYTTVVCLTHLFQTHHLIHDVL